MDINCNLDLIFILNLCGCVTCIHFSFNISIYLFILKCGPTLWVPLSFDVIITRSFVLLYILSSCLYSVFFLRKNSCVVKICFMQQLLIPFRFMQNHLLKCVYQFCRKIICSRKGLSPNLVQSLAISLQKVCNVV